MSKAAATRLNILQKSFELIYKNGYQSTSIDDILSTMEVTKGAFFYHFKNKEEMGLAMIKEVMKPGMQRTLIQPLANAEDPVTDIYEMMEALLAERIFFDVKYGCPAINLIEEMAPASEAFNKQLTVLVKDWQAVIYDSLEKGKTTGRVKAEVNSSHVALYITSGYAGIRNMGKIFGRSAYTSYLKEFKKYLEQLR